jgi:hypothetical protein
METQLCRVLSHSGNITKIIQDLDNLYAVRRMGAPIACSTPFRTLARSIKF